MSNDKQNIDKVLKDLDKAKLDFKDPFLNNSKGKKNSPKNIDVSEIYS